MLCISLAKVVALFRVSLFFLIKRLTNAPVIIKTKTVSANATKVKMTLLNSVSINSLILSMAILTRYYPKFPELIRGIRDSIASEKRFLTRCPRASGPPANDSTC